MTVLADDRDTRERMTYQAQINQVAEGADSTQFYKGGILVLDQADGKVKKGFVAATLVCLGRSEERILTGVGNTRRPKAKSGIFNWDNSGGADTIAADDIGKDCFIVDDQTVGLTDGGATRSKAGKVYEIEGTQVWVTVSTPVL